MIITGDLSLIQYVQSDSINAPKQAQLKEMDIIRV